MIISDLKYLELATEANDLNGGADIGGSLTAYIQQLRQLQTVASSGPGGSYAAQGALNLNILTAGISFVALGV